MTTDTPSRSWNRADGEARSNAIYQEIRNRIRLLQYPPGMVLREGALAKEFGVSRTPIRQILQRLEFEELVTTAHGTGTIVTTVDLKSLKEIYALRLRLVELTGELSPARISEESLEALDKLLKQCQEMRGNFNPEALADLYNCFHDIMLNAIGNRHLRKITDQLFHQTARVWLQILPDLDWEEEVDCFCDEVSRVIGALTEGDTTKMVAVRREHMVKLLHRINQYLGGGIIEQV